MKFLRTSAGSEAAAEQTRSCTITRTRGFTLLELLVVIVIIGLLASYVGPKYFAQVNRSETTLAKAQLASFEKALDAFRLDTGRYPTTEEGLNALIVQPATLANWNGPYLKREVPPDPWGRPYQYRAPGPKGEFEVKTLGKSGTPGGTGESAEITIP
ncbi:type II secretion system major pseudopilin GspG [Burkholderia cenocepacia]|uniref:type II secretion system major pseudopilin GspG n=1 Tax=Burkholderia cenocepacia TaxID=95486 RepID=UPI000F55D9AC|nr:type II secretion system major pseudopilin GspG [Burkholderia cenocepacia]RQU30130.1 type II secretion system protein GspG [Burkholderia cenocepacia]RQU54455.1 type II secretion system protein GspG [Burkholderia cenocepacia]